MPTPTTTYSFSKPTVGGDDNAWGTELNNNLDKLDDLLDGTLSITPNLATGWEVGGVAVTSTAAELNVLDGVTASTAEINILDGVTASTAELNILDGVTATTAEINKLDGLLPTTTELNYVDGATSNLQDQINSIVAGQVTITGAASTIDTENLTANRAVISNASGKIAVSTVTSTELSVLDGITATTTELNYTDGVTSNIQTQLNAKQATITGGATTITSSNLTASRALVSDGSGKVAVSAVASTELGYLSGVTSSIQTQLNAKQATITGGASTIVTDNLTVNRALASDASGKVVVSPVTSTELGYLDGVTSNVQTQLNGKQATITLVALRALVSDSSGKIAVSGITAAELGHLTGAASNIQTQLNGKAANTTQTQATWEAGTSTTETIVSPAKVKAAIDALVTVYEDGEDATTSGTAHDFTSIPAGMNHIEVMLQAVGVSGSDNLLIQIGTGGSPTTSGYSSSSVRPGLTATSTTGFVIALGNASYGITGTACLDRVPGTNSWVFTSTATLDPIIANTLPVSAGRVTLSGVLDNIRLTRTGSDTFDAGGWSIRCRK